ncbi:MAG TPA: Uma2 family endonuclease [Chloroflexia bacterium]|nr:Uma2 family endonuclease [Chloroflexia bacterium]
MLNRAQPIHTLQEYLALEEQSEDKHEYYQGQIFLMAGGSVNHNRISFNLAGLLYQKLAGSTCEAFSSDMRLLVKANGLYTYPDLMVVCGSLDLAPGRTDTVTNPLVIIEVLSESTAEYDRTDKFELYKELESLENYILVDQHRSYIQCFRRVKDEPKLWAVESYRHLEENLRIPALDLELSLKEIYHRVEWPQADTTHPTTAE